MTGKAIEQIDDGRALYSKTWQVSRHKRFESQRVVICFFSPRTPGAMLRQLRVPAQASNAHTVGRRRMPKATRSDDPPPKQCDAASAVKATRTLEIAELATDTASPRLLVAILCALLPATAATVIEFQLF